MKFDQDMRLNLRCDFGKLNSTLGAVVPLAMFIITVISVSRIIALQAWLAKKLRKFPKVAQSRQKDWDFQHIHENSVNYLSRIAGDLSRIEDIIILWVFEVATAASNWRPRYTTKKLMKSPYKVFKAFKVQSEDNRYEQAGQSPKKISITNTNQRNKPRRFFL